MPYIFVLYPIIRSFRKHDFTLETCSCDVLIRLVSACLGGRRSVGWVDKDDYADILMFMWNMMNGT